MKSYGKFKKQLADKKIEEQVSISLIISFIVTGSVLITLFHVFS